MIPAGLDADRRGYHHLYRSGTALAAGHDLGVADNVAMLGMSRILEGPDGLIIQKDDARHAAGSARASAHSSTSSGLAPG
jgi:hypothetical protein